MHVRPGKEFSLDYRERMVTRYVDRVAEAAGDFIGVSDDKFFLVVGFDDPHTLPKGYKPTGDGSWARFGGRPAKPLVYGEVPPFPFQRLEAPIVVRRTTEYYNACMRLDEGVGKLLEVLDKTGHRDDTLVVFISDHGPPFYRAKTTCYEGGVKVPLIVRWPKVFKPGERSDALVCAVDLLPTIMDAAAGKTPAGLHGRSLRHTLDKAQHRRFLATETNYHRSTPFYPRRAIRDSRFKLIHNLRAGKARPQTEFDSDRSYELSRKPKFEGVEAVRVYAQAADPPEFEVFDLEQDPWEFKDLAAQPEHAKTLARLQQALLDWRRQTADPLLTPAGTKAMAALEKSVKKR